MFPGSSLPWPRRSTSEVLMHVALTNFYLLSITGPRMPADATSLDMEKTV